MTKNTILLTTLFGVWLGIPSMAFAQTSSSPFTAQQSYSNWTDFYVGADVGGAFGTSQREDLKNGQSSKDYSIAGVIGGGTLGYNKQWGSIVTGLEGDISGSGVGGSANCPTPTLTCETNNAWLATVRPRLGYAFNRFMPYITGGLAVGDVNVQSYRTSTDVGTENLTKTQVGWTAGAGIETAISSNWSIKGEYLFVQLPDTNLPLSDGLPGSTKFSENILRVGLNYAFK